MNDEPSIASLLAQNTPDAAAHLNELAQTGRDKDTRKSARRALYLLAQKGIVPPAPAPASSMPHNISIKADLQAWASAFDGAGNRLLFLTWPDPDGGSPTFLQCLMNDVEGVRDIETGRVTRKDLAERLNGFEAQIEAGIALAPIEADYGRALLHQARTLNRQARRTTPTGFLELLRVVGDPLSELSERSQSPVWNAITPADIENDTGLPRDPAALFALPWFDAWFLDVNDVAGWLMPIMEVVNRPDVDADTLKDAVAQTARDASGILFADGLKTLYAHRLEESADILRRRERIVPARQALYHALALQNEGGSALFAVALVERTMQAAVEMASQIVPR